MGSFFGYLLVPFQFLFVKVSGWSELVERYKAFIEPVGSKLERQTIKVGAVRWRFCVTVVLNPVGLYVKLPGSSKTPSPVLIPWSEFKSKRKGWLYLGWSAVELSVGEPKIAVMTFPQDLYEKMAVYLANTPNTTK